MLLPWNLIKDLLTLATGPIAVMLVQLASMLQNQRNANNSSQAEAEDQHELRGLLRGVNSRLDRLVELFQQNFMPAVTPAYPNVVDPDPMPSVPGRAEPARLPPDSSGGTSSDSLQVARQQVAALMTHVNSRHIDTSFITNLSRAEREAKTIWQERTLDDSLLQFSRREREALDQAFPDWESVRDVLRMATANNEILVFPRVRGAATDKADVFYRDLSASISRYNWFCETRTQARPPDLGPSRLRQAQKLRLASDVLASDLVWTDTIVAAVQKALHMMPAICVQVDVSVSTSQAQIAAWLWAMGDTRPIAFKPNIPLTSDRYPSVDVAFSTAHMLIILLADALSLGAAEGVSVLANLLADQGMPGESGTQAKYFRKWYQTAHDVFGGSYGEAGIVGVPVVEAPPAQTELINGPQAELLAGMRGALLTQQFSTSTRGYTDGRYLFLAAQDNDSDSANVFYLVIEERGGQQIAIWGQRQRLGSAPPNMENIAKRLNECAEQCLTMHMAEAHVFKQVAIEAMDTLKYHLGEQLRAVFGAG